MLREKNVVKFVKDSSVLRPGYYVGIDMRKKLVIFGIRGTHTVYDLITDIITTGHEEPQMKATLPTLAQLRLLVGFYTMRWVQLESAWRSIR